MPNRKAGKIILITATALLFVVAAVAFIWHEFSLNLFASAAIYGIFVVVEFAVLRRDNLSAGIKGAAILSALEVVKTAASGGLLYWWNFYAYTSAYMFSPANNATGTFADAFWYSVLVMIFTALLALSFIVMTVYFALKCVKNRRFSK